MKIILFISLLVFLFLFESRAQSFSIVPLTKSEKEDKDLSLHYFSKRDGFSGTHLYLYSNGRFHYKTYTDLASWISSGLWKYKKDTLELKSELRKNTLPLKVTYLAKASSGFPIKTFEVIKDLAGREYTKAAIHINNDSVTCFGGDTECFGSYETIDSVKVTIDNNVTSGWFSVDPTKGIIQLIVQTDIDLNNYFPLDLRLGKKKNKLEYIKN